MEADDELNDSKTSKEDQRTYKAIQRVHRACNACRKQKARCEGPEDPPCRRCKQIGIDCIFEKPPKDLSSGADAGPSADRIKNLESQMLGMQSMLGELVASIKANTQAIASAPIVQATTDPTDVSHNDSYQYPSSLDILDHSQSRHNTTMVSSSSQGRSYYRGLHPRPSLPADVLARYQAEPAAPLRRSHQSSSSDTRMESQPLQQIPAYLLQQPPYQDTFASHLDGDSTYPDSDEADYSGHVSGAYHGNQPHRSTSRHASWTGTQPSTYANKYDQTALPAPSRSPKSHLWNGTSPPKRQWSSSTDRPFEAQFSPSEAGLLPPEASEAGGRGMNNHRRKLTPDSSAHYEKDTDISNEQLSAPIEALRGLADAAAAAAEEEEELDSHLSGDSIGQETRADKSVKTPARENTGSVNATTPVQQISGVEYADKSLKPNTVDSLDSEPTSRKKRRRDNDTVPPEKPAVTLDAGPADTSIGVTSTSMGNTTSAKGKMEAPELVKNSAGDLVTLGLVSVTDAMRLFETFQKGVPKFISIFHLEDEPSTTEQAYQHVRSTSYFLFNTMIAIGAKVECGGRPPSRLYQTCMAQAKRNAKETMFSAVAGKEAVQAMVLLASYSENGWLTLGLSIRMAQELGLDRSFQKLMSALPSSGYIKHPQPPPPPKHLTFYHASPQSSQFTGSPTDGASVGDGAGSIEGKTSLPGNPIRKESRAVEGNVEELKDLARGARLWFFLFLFDHQASYGAGRPAMLSKHYVRNCRAFLTLQYPLTVKTDARFISTLELLIIRETHYDAMAPYDQPVDSRMLLKMRKVSEELNEWHRYWSKDFEMRGYGQDSFFQQSLILQCASAELYLTCTALRGIRDANDADQMGPEQKELIIQATRAADTCLTVSVDSKEYKEMLGWAPHYTHVTAAFACVFLIKIAGLFPRQVDTYGIFSNAERLASRLAEVPATKYARVIRILLAQAWKKITDLSPTIGLYAALGAEATRPGAITPAEIKTGGPSDSGISLLYRLLQEHQQGQLPLDSSDVLASSSVAAAYGPGGGHGTRTPKGFWDVHGQSNWLMSSVASPNFSFNTTGGIVTPRKFGSVSGAAQNIDAATADGIAWSNFVSSHTPSAPVGVDNAVPAVSQPLQLPLWMQESTGAYIDPASSPGNHAAFGEHNTTQTDNASHNWGQRDHYQSPIPHNAASPVFQTPQHHLHTPRSGHQQQSDTTPSQQQQQQMHYIGPSQAQQGLQQSQTSSAGAHRSSQRSKRTRHPSLSNGPGMQSSTVASASFMPTNVTNFDSVLSDLGLPLDGLDGLFVDLPINAASGHSTHSV